MKAKWLPISAAVIMALGSASASAVDFHGYMRSGVGISQDGDMQAFSNNGENVDKQKVGRLGNEDDTYSEVQLGQEVYNKAGKTFYVDSMFAMTSNGSNDWEDTSGKGRGDDGADFALRQFNVQAKGLFGGNEVTWAGKRYYQRHDIHITDNYYWNISGAGAGVEAIQAGPGQLSFAWVRNDRADSEGTGVTGALNVNTLDARYAGIPLWSDATLEVGADYAIVRPTDAQDAERDDLKNGVLLTTELTQGLLGGFNKTVLQYGTEGYAKNFAFYGDGSWYAAETADNSADGFRIINHGAISLGDSWDLSHQLLYAVANDWNPGYSDKYETFSVVIRPVYKWTDTVKTIFEAGYSEDTISYVAAQNHSDDTSDGSKFTIAQAFSAGKGFWARPEIRVFASYLTAGGEKWQGAEQTPFNGGKDDSTWNFGVQAEAWW